MNVNLQWDAKKQGDSRTSVRIYERTGTGTPYSYGSVLADVPDPTPSTVLQNISPGSHTYIARAVTKGTNGIPEQESADSNAVTIVVLAPPAIPTNLIAKAN